MSRTCDLYVIPTAPTDRHLAVYATHRALTEEGALSDDSFLSLETTDSVDYEPEPVIDMDESLRRLVNWAGSGGMDTVLMGTTIDTYFDTEPATLKVKAVRLSTRERLFEAGGEALRDAFLRLGHRLHQELHAARTLMDCGLHESGFDLNDEIKRLRRGEFKNTYDILDLRSHV